MSVRQSQGRPRACSGLHVAHGAQDHTLAGGNVDRGGIGSAIFPKQSLRAKSCQSEVEDFDAAVFGDEKVLGLEVAVDDALLVGRREALGDLHTEVHGFGWRKRPASQALTERLAFEQFGDNVVNRLALPFCHVRGRQAAAAVPVCGARLLPPRRRFAPPRGRLGFQPLAMTEPPSRCHESQGCWGGPARPLPSPPARTGAGARGPPRAPPAAL